MADSTITALPAAGALNGTEVFPVDQAGATKKATTQAVALAVSSFVATGLVIPLASAFTVIGTGTTLTDKTDRLQLSCTASATQQLRGGTVASIAPPYTIDMCVGTCGSAAANDSFWVGLGVSDGTKYRMWYAGIRVDAANNGVLRAAVDSWTNVTTYLANILVSPFAFDLGHLFVRLTDDATNRKMYISSNGKDFVLFYSEASNTYLTPTKFVLASYCANATFALKANIQHWLVTPSVLGDAA